MDGSGLRFETMDHVGEYPDTMAQASLFTLPLALGNCLPTITLGQRGPSCSSREAARQQFNFFGTAKARRAKHGPGKACFTSSSSGSRAPARFDRCEQKRRPRRGGGQRWGRRCNGFARRGG